MNAHRSTIAVIDDESAVQESLRNLLESEGYDVLVFSSAEAFLAARSSINVDCVISDIRMPGLSGLELLRILHAEDQSLGVIMITAQKHGVKDISLIEAGAQSLFRKPFDVALLLDAVSRAVRLRS